MSGAFNSDPGSSKSTNSQTTTSIDGRVVGGDQSTNLSLNGNTGPVQITTTDAGAIHDSLALALAGVEGANATAAAATSGALTAVQQGQAQFTSAIEQIKTGDKTTKVVVVGAVVAAVAFAYFMRKA
jgi:hypothetical protein